MNAKQFYDGVAKTSCIEPGVACARVVDASAHQSITKLAALLIGTLTAISPLQGFAALITTVSASSGSSYEIVNGGLNNEVLTYTDRIYVYRDLLSSLIGADYIKTHEEDKYNTSLQVSVTLSSAARLYLFFDDQYGAPSWVTTSGFVDTGDNITVYGPPEQPYPGNWLYSVYEKDVLAGPVDLYQTKDYSMYGIAAAEISAVPEPSTCMAGALLLLPLGGGLLRWWRK